MRFTAHSLRRFRTGTPIIGRNSQITGAVVLAQQRDYIDGRSSGRRGDKIDLGVYVSVFRRRSRRFRNERWAAPLPVLTVVMTYPFIGSIGYATTDESKGSVSSCTRDRSRPRNRAYRRALISLEHLAIHIPRESRSSRRRVQIQRG